MSTDLVPGTQVAAADLDRMAALLFDTSYLEYCSAGNTLGLPLRALQRRQNIEPYLDHIRALYVDGVFAGFFNAATIADYAALQPPSYYRDEVRAMDAAYDEFVSRHTHDNDLFVASLAVVPALRGRGHFNVLLAAIEALARARHAPRIALTVWEGSPALPIYLDKGFRRCGVFDYAYPLFFERLQMLARLTGGE